jgi:hypothetical protein
MMKETYTAKSGDKRYRPVLTERTYRNAEDSYKGFCIACGSTRGNCEPDARGYECPKCKQPKVYGIPELLMMGIARIK